MKMSQLERQKESKGGKVRKTPTTATPRLLSWKPTKEQARDIQEQGYTVSSALSKIEEFAREGHKISLGVPLDRPGCYALMRDGLVSWDVAVGVSCWATSLENALVCLGYYLDVVNREFPDMQGQFHEQLTFEF
jgi:hypothetical protein